MRKIFLLFLVVICSTISYGQLSGIKTIPGDYATIAAAVADLNAQGVGSGGLTFEVNAGYVENITAPILVTATGTSTAPIEFMKSGARANPSITRADAVTSTS